MSRIIKATGYRNLSHVVRTKNGKYYMIDSNDTPDAGFETMGFLWDFKKGRVLYWGELYAERYDSEDEMNLRHFEICQDFENYVWKTARAYSPPRKSPAKN